jgi:hypothetical protein
MLLAMGKNKTSKTKLVKTPPTPVFEIAIRKRRTKPAAPNPKSQKRENVFSKSRDTREDRGARQMKTSHNSQTFPH